MAARGDAETSVELRYEDEDIGLKQRALAKLYDVTVPTIVEHADYTKAHMGLTTWQDAADGKKYLTIELIAYCKYS